MLDNTASIVLVCNGEGAVEQVLRDSMGMCEREVLGRPMHALVDSGSAVKALRFLAEAKDQGVVFDWQMNLLHRGALIMLHFAASVDGDHITILGTPTRDSLVRLCTRMLPPGSGDAANALHACQDASRNHAAGDIDRLEELSRLNNELVNAQRELARANAELEIRNAELDIAQTRLQQQQDELIEANLKLERLATQDPLTGLANRRKFQERFTAEFSRARRYGEALSVIMLDLDHFKAYNDSFGHAGGDDVLRRVAAVMNRNVRDTDIVARQGGEEFAALLCRAGRNEALAVAERLRRSIEQVPWPHRPVSASIGVATLGPGIPTAERLLDLADKALYRSKENGRNRVTHADDPPQAGTASKAQVEN